MYYFYCNAVLLLLEYEHSRILQGSYSLCDGCHRIHGQSVNWKTSTVVSRHRQNMHISETKTRKRQGGKDQGNFKSSSKLLFTSINFYISRHSTCFNLNYNSHWCNMILIIQTINLQYKKKKYRDVQYCKNDNVRI